MIWIVIGVVVLGGLLVAAVGYLGLVSGAIPVDLGVGRRTRPLGPQVHDIAAPRELVFDIIAAPYQRRQPRAMAAKVQVLERGADMVLAAHRTQVHRGLVATTVETVRFDRPERISFVLVRGPVPYVLEQFVLSATEQGTRLDYDGELGTDLWAIGSWWGRRVARSWERAVAASLASVKAEAERRHSTTRPA